jgi:hypothetical protein
MALAAFFTIHKSFICVSKKYFIEKYVEPDLPLPPQREKNCKCPAGEAGKWT